LKSKIKCFSSIIIVLILLACDNIKASKEDEQFLPLGNAKLTSSYSEKLLEDKSNEDTQNLDSSDTSGNSEQRFLWQKEKDQQFETWLKKETEKVEEEGEKIIEGEEEKSYLTPYLEVLRRWKRPVTIDIEEIRERRIEALKPKEEGISLPLDSNLQISGYKSVRVEYNLTHYFGESDIAKYGGYSSGYSSSGLDLGLTSSYYDSGYSSYGYSDYGGYDSYSSYGSYGYGGSRYGGATGINIEQELQIGLHGRIGKHTHVAIDYSDVDSGGYMSSYGGGTEQKIKVWYEGDAGDIIQRVAFGDLTLSLPNTRFLSVNRNLFGLEAVAQLGGMTITAFGSRSKGISEERTFQGESRRAGGGTGIRIADANYVDERYYMIQLGEDGYLHDAYLPIKTGSEEIYIDDGNGSNNQGGQKTARGYFNLQYPGQDYNIDYETGEIEFLTQISPNYKIVVAYEYLGDGGGKVGNPGDVFVDENENGVIDEEDDFTEELGYVVIKDQNLHGTESRRVYNLGNRNISRSDFDITIWDMNGKESFQTDEGTVPYVQIFGLDQDGDGIVDYDFIDFERGLLTFNSMRPFMIENPESPYYEYRDQLNNEAIYSENPRYGDQMYTILANYSYRSESYNLGLFIIPDSETVYLNGRKLKRDIDYQIIYEVGSITFFTELDEFDEIKVEFERTPFGGALQQTVAGIWAEYTYRPKPKEKKQPEDTKPGDRFDRFGSSGRSSFSSSGYDSYSRSRYGGSSSSYSSYGQSFGSSSYSSSYGSGYSSGYDSYSSGYSSGRRRSYGVSSSYFSPSYTKGFSITAGYIYNTGGKVEDIPDVNSAPRRLQAFDINTSFGKNFNLAWLLNPLPLISVEDFPLSVDFSGEAAYSRNNPNSVGYALIDSMEGVKDSSSTPTFKYNWKICSLPLFSANDNIYSQENRAIFRIIPKDKEDASGNYMKNKEVPASVINPLAQSVDNRLVMEIGYDFRDIVEEWGGFSYGISSSGVDYIDKEFLEMAVRVKGEDDVILHIDFGVLSEDTDEDNVLDSEDLPPELKDDNGDGIIDILDLDLENLPEKHKYRGNGSLDKGEDTGWVYNNIDGDTAIIGKNNTVLDTEDLNGDGVLDSDNYYFEISIPLREIPDDWVKRVNEKTGWKFLSIPLSSFRNYGSPSWGFIKHVRLWLEKEQDVTSAKGTFEWASLELIGNQWTRGVITDSSFENVIGETEGKFIVGAKNNYDFEDYIDAYREIEDNKIFKELHPYSESSSLGYGYQEQREQSLSLNYVIEPGHAGVTTKQLKGKQRGDGQDFRNYKTLRFWLYGDKSGATFVMRLCANLRTTSYSSYYYYRSDPFAQPQEEEEINLLENIGDFYEYVVPINFDGWKMVEIPMDIDEKTNESLDAPLSNISNIENNETEETEDNEDKTGPDGHPDAFIVKGSPSISNIGGILIGLKNNTDHEVSGEIWINEIHLAEPLVRSGWAGRGNMSIDLGNILRVRGGYSNQDKDFENSAGQTGRSSQRDMGYSTTSNDYNIDADLSIFRWLPIHGGIRYQESETETRLGTISSYNSGRNWSKNRTLGARFNIHPLVPSLSFSFDQQTFWNENRGTEFSDLYSSTLNYSIGNRLRTDLQYRHESVTSDATTALEESQTSSYSSYSYSSYYGSSGDEIIDSGSVSLDLTPFPSFSLNPSFDVRRELEKRTVESSNQSSSNQTDGEDEEKPEEKFMLTSRERRLSLTPRINRDLWGFRPSINTRASFRENWYSGQKSAYINANIRLGLGIRPKEWFGSDEPEQEIDGAGKPKEQETIEPDSQKIEETDTPQENKSEGDVEESSDTEEKTNNANQENTNKENIIDNQPGKTAFDIEQEEEKRREEHLERLKRMGVDEMDIEEIESEQGDWISRDKAELERKLRERQKEPQKAGLLRRSIDSLAFNFDVDFDMRDSLRQLDPAMDWLEMLKLEDEAKERSQSSQGQRYSFRSSIDPFTWSSFSANISYRNDFSKSSGTSYRSKSRDYEGDVKLFNSDNSSSFQIRYRYSNIDRSNVSGTIAESLSHEPSLSWRQRWTRDTNTSLGVRLTLRDRERSGIETNSLIITPNLNIDYALRVKGKKWKLPIWNKEINLTHDFDITNTFSTVIRREKLGLNREEKSERYETSLRANYNLSARLRMDLNLGISYNNDRVEEGRNYLSVSSSVMVRGEFR